MKSVLSWTVCDPSRTPRFSRSIKQILDFRHDQVSSSAEFYYRCLKNLDLSLFSANLT